MLAQNNRALKEWAISCEALKSGRQTLLLRKGGIREEDGRFQVRDPEFFLLPTYEHQTGRLLQPDLAARLAKMPLASPGGISIDAYAVVDTVSVVEDESRLPRLAGEHIWNDRYVRLRLEFNPYDPLYTILLRVYLLPGPFVLPMRAEYVGCKSWVTLDRTLSTAGATPAIPDDLFESRRSAVLGNMG
jgi:hypothetical protein